MELLGTVYNGQIQLDHPANLPNGTRIVSLPADEYEATSENSATSQVRIPASDGSIRRVARSQVDPTWRFSRTGRRKDNNA